MLLFGDLSFRLNRHSYKQRTLGRFLWDFFQYKEICQDVTKVSMAALKSVGQGKYCKQACLESCSESQSA